MCHVSCVFYVGGVKENVQQRAGLSVKGVNDACVILYNALLLCLCIISCGDELMTAAASQPVNQSVSMSVRSTLS